MKTRGYHVRCVACRWASWRTYQEEEGYGRCRKCDGEILREKKHLLAQDQKAKRELAELAQGARL